MTAEEFKRELDELRKIIWDGVACYWVWRGLQVEDKESLTALNQYTAFSILHVCACGTWRYYNLLKSLTVTIER